MKAVVLTGIRRMKLIDSAIPSIKRETDVLIRIEAVGICGSDVHYYTSGRIGSQIVKYPYRVGHECAGTVVKIGKAVRKLRLGDGVAVDPAAWCGKCDQCQARRFHTCRKLTFLGTPTQGDGCLCEYLVMPEASCVKIKHRTTMEQAALVEPLSIGYYGVQLHGDIRGKDIAILGAGPIGLCVMLVARELGARRIYVTDRIDSRLRAAKLHGASWTGNPDKLNIVSAILKKQPLQLDAVFECCGQQDAVDQGLELLKPGGKLLLIGIPECERVSIKIDIARRREITIQNVRRQNECVEPALALVESGRIKPDFMITHRFSLEESKKGFDLVAGYSDGVIKAMILR